MRSMIDAAWIVAEKAHRGQFDKAGKPYLSHPVAVCLMFKTEKHQVVALLHDVVEDSEYTLEDLRQMGFSEEIVSAVEAITKVKNEPYVDYLSRVKRNSIARAVKIADLMHNSNLSRIPNPSEKDYARNEKYKKALRYLNGES